MKNILSICAASALSLFALTATPVVAGDDFEFHDDEFSEYHVYSYSAYISRDDIFNSSGDRLRDVGAILRQDRANVHRFGISQRGDEVDPYFSETYMREMLPEAADRGHIPGYIEEAIIAGNAMLTVHMYALGDTLHRVELDLH